MSGLAAGAAVTLTDLPAYYGLAGICADENGKIYIWLPDGTYDFTANGISFRAVVDGAATQAHELFHSGVFVGDDEVGVEIAGAGWAYDHSRSRLTLTGGVTLSGTNTAGKVRCRVESSADIVFSNLCLKATGSSQTPFEIASNVTANITFTGTNTFAAGKYCAAISVPYESSVSLGGDGWLFASGGSGDDWSYPGIGASEGTYYGLTNVVVLSGNLVATTPNEFVSPITGALIAGGNVNMRESGNARDPNCAMVYRVRVKDLPAGELVTITGLPDYYDVSGIRADGSGDVYLWLKAGSYSFTVNGVKYLAGVLGGATTAVVHDLEVYVNGSNVCMLSGTGWEYNVADKEIQIVSAGDYTITGTNTEGKVCVYIMADDGAVNLTLDNLCLSGYSTRWDAYGPIYISDIWNTTEVNITLVGTNILTSTDYSANMFYHAGIFVPWNRTLTIGGDGSLYVETRTGAAIGATDESGGYFNRQNCGTINIIGGRITAKSSGGNCAAIGCRSGGSIGNIAISGGTVDAAASSGQAIGTGGDYPATITITGGSVKATDSGTATSARNDSSAALSCVTVDGLAQGAAVAFDGLPGYYGTGGIYADGEGKAYLWLPQNWTDPVKPKLAAAPSAGTTHTFSANGYRYTVAIPASGGGAAAEKGEALELSALKITDFAVEDGCLLISVTANPATWLYGFADTLTVRASESLPIPDTDESALDLSGAKLLLEDGDSATFLVPLGEKSSCRFFKVRDR